MKVRARQPADVDPLLEIAQRVRVQDSYPAYLPDNDMARFLFRPEPLKAWVGEIDGQIAGHVALNSESHADAMETLRRAGLVGKLGVVARLLVDPAFRRLGLGAVLLRHARDEAVSQGRIPVLDVVASSAPAIRLYQSAGWVEVGHCTFVSPGYRPIDEIVFVDYRYPLRGRRHHEA